MKYKYVFLLILIIILIFFLINNNNIKENMSKLTKKEGADMVISSTSILGGIVVIIAIMAVANPVTHSESEMGYLKKESLLDSLLNYIPESMGIKSWLVISIVILGILVALKLLGVSVTIVAIIALVFLVLIALWLSKKVIWGLYNQADSIIKSYRSKGVKR